MPQRHFEQLKVIQIHHAFKERQRGLIFSCLHCWLLSYCLRRSAAVRVKAGYSKAQNRASLYDLFILYRFALAVFPEEFQIELPVGLSNRQCRHACR